MLVVHRTARVFRIEEKEDKLENNMDIDAKVNKKIFLFLENTKKRINAIFGGAGSGKSYTIAQFLLLRKLYQEKDKRILVVRKTLPALRITAYQLVLDLLAEYQLPHQLNKTEMTISVGNSKMLFKSLDDPEKIKSYEGNYVWIEEATEISHKDFMQLNLRLRRRTEGLNQMFLSFNPIDQFHWLNENLLGKARSDLADNWTTYKDNPFLDPTYIEELEHLKDEDENYYRIYTLGKWGVLRNIIYSNYEIIDKWPDSLDETIYGLDFGFNNPTVLLEIGIKDQKYYERELLYESGLTGKDLLEKLDDLIADRTTEIYADSEAADRIVEIAREGYNIHKSRKGKGSVKDGIDFVKRHKLFIHRDSVNLINEIRSYKYKEDKDGHVLEEPVKFRDHAMDAFRYAIYTHGRVTKASIFIIE